MSSNPKDVVSVTSSYDQSIEEFGKKIGKFDFDIKQLSKGNFQGQSTTIELGDLSLIRRKANTRFVSIGNYLDHAIFIFPLDKGCFTTNNHLYNENSQLVLAGKLNSCSVFPVNSDQIIISIKTDVLNKYLSSLEIQVFTIAMENEKLSILNAYKEKITTNLYNIYKEITSKDKIEFPASDYCKTIISLLYTYISLHQVKSSNKSSNYGKIFHRALHYINNNPEKNINLETLSSQIYASKRSVQYAFLEAIDLSPILFIKLIKMNNIRKELLGCNKKSGISATLHKYHVTNIGRFSQEYFEFFGERPRETIIRENN